jgi:hypothetical protein
MTTDRNDEPLRQAFRTVRESDERDAPAFDALLTRGSRITAPARMSRGRLALAAGFILAIAVLHRGIGLTRERLTVPPDVLALSAWRPATDVLLTSTTMHFTRAPLLGASLIEINPGGLPQ